jgi:hypothetical protein
MPSPLEAKRYKLKKNRYVLIVHNNLPLCISPKTKSAKLNSCENDLYVEIEEQDFFKHNRVVMIARIFNMLLVPVKMIEDNKNFICQVKEIVHKHQYYDMNEFFNCQFEL